MTSHHNTPPLLSDKLTTEELAIELKRSEATLLRWRRLRIGPPYLRLQGRVLYDRQKVQDWIEKQLVEV
ncbi:helix-turn-helix transcriptional regulator [Luteimonas mephitis]|uniref:helix-turn-helix transcriptional regulator n=1 Tax=Luteimonas mephitis TaxID=83615 RepID=UPI000415ED0F|nr:helix-turn-helix domain-containing protein [Luteimonas mephitis]